MRLINRIADRVLDRLAPQSSAYAGCYQQFCQQPGCYRVCCDGHCGDCQCTYWY